MAQLRIENLHVAIEGKEILKGVNLVINENEIHAIMGPNGNGKSTLLSAIMGHPRYEITEGSVYVDDINVLELEVDERSKLGLFLGMQYPQEVSGVTNSDFLKSALNARRETPIGLFEFVKSMEGSIERLKMKEDLAHRFLNEGFSGGEKKRNEILQMIMLEPRFAMLDEIDSGLDIDALALVAKVLKEEQDKQKMGLIIVSHYERFFELIQPTHTHIMIDGRIVLSSDETLVSKIDREGYDWIERTLEKEKATKRPSVLGTCAVREAMGDK
ncbi:Fe-S cluster assembly ATPase SufC [Erysipelothrix sp. strain 2 (EsS2-7-Brazil)]|uniref:Fe-S cluster assembly ATPase SufC n=1 Tax=Erysipelothrix sp. strain 2 (EsS2-7-Brazil) TaxID=2500579 RepID=UPI00190985C2|nr:Fe-S cluster assembly ATPase SufC [Erysipelothrix sp. strain 2 (EsS2-7-Brazil)]MBK2403999.1 Fe-S cluster assembly ATPase SufC [Erysipelothrix sp. strain 2 (EsS2-7-Brazil)]